MNLYKTTHKKIIYFLKCHWKWIYPLVFVIFFVWAYPHHVSILQQLTQQTNSLSQQLFHYTFYIVFWILSILLFFLSLLIASRPLIKCVILKHKFLQAGIKNGEGVPLILLSVRPESSVSRRMIYTFKNSGICVDKLESKICQLEAALRARVKLISYDATMSTIEIVTVEPKYDCPMEISIHSKSICEEPNLLVVGATGTGKSWCMMTVLGAFTQFYSDITVTICDFKKSTFAMFENNDWFYGYTDVPDGIRSVYKEFSERLQANDPIRNKNIHLLVIDEYGAMLQSLDKKVADEMRSKVAEMLFMSRSLGIRIMLGVQRADAELFKTGSRDQFRQILALGNISKEQKQMLFADYKDAMTDRNGTGEGYLLIDGKPILRIKVANLADFEQFCAHLKCRLENHSLQIHSAQSARMK